MRPAALVLVLVLGFSTTSTSEEIEISTVFAEDLGGLDARSAALVLSGQQGGELDVSVLPIPVAGGPDGVRVVLVVDVVDAAPAGTDEPRVTEVYAYALDEELGIAGYLTQGFRLDPAERRGVKFFGRLDLEPGRYSLRVLVLRRSRERMGLVVQPLDVAPWDDGRMPPELAGEPPEDWVLVRQATADDASFPVMIGGRPVIPATRPKAATSPAVSEAAGAAIRSAGPPRRRELLTRYSEALRLLSRSRPVAAREALVALEGSAFDRGLQDVLAPRLLELASRLANVERESLVPLIRLHEEVYRDHHHGRRYLHATHSKRMLVGLGEIYVAQGSPETSRKLIADAFASLGGFLQEIGSTLAAEVAYKDALEYQGDHETALLGLASVLEFQGDRSRSAEALKRLLDHHPDNAEARLRRAVCLARLGSTREAAALYTMVLDGDRDVPRWVRAVAYQELAELHAREKRFEAAVEVLGDALEELPDLQRIHVQLAALYDRMGRPSRAHVALARLNPVAGRESDSPRLIYSRWPRRAIEATRRSLAEAADSRLDALTAALAAAPAGSGEPGS